MVFQKSFPRSGAGQVQTEGGAAGAEPWGAIGFLEERRQTVRGEELVRVSGGESTEH